ncbi:DUF4402 domain-containing protein [Lacibacterium aquatile]|uniref:DUF4402 domain-containing protein n=1 Tax=Lacibacterium aquatile TaxID=1168082 RepID=A0ABW5DYC8_9PROT
MRIPILNGTTILLAGMVLTAGDAEGVPLSDSKSAIMPITAKVIAPVIIQKLSDLSFGKIAPAASGAASVVQVPLSGPRTITVANGATLTGGSWTPAKFQISGNAGLAVTITFPTKSYSLKHSSGAPNMNMVLETPTTPMVLATGWNEITVGGNLTVAAGQVPGIYTSNAIQITVNYQ